MSEISYLKIERMAPFRN